MLAVKSLSLHVSWRTIRRDGFNLMAAALALPRSHSWQSYGVFEIVWNRDHILGVEQS